MSEPHVHPHPIRHPAHGSVPPPKSPPAVAASRGNAPPRSAAPAAIPPDTALPSTARPGVPVSPRLEARGPLWHDLLTEATEQERLARAAEAEAFARLQQLGRVAHAD